MNATIDTLQVDRKHTAETLRVLVGYIRLELNDSSKDACERRNAMFAQKGDLEAKIRKIDGLIKRETNRVLAAANAKIDKYDWLAK